MPHEHHEFWISPEVLPSFKFSRVLEFCPKTQPPGACGCDGQHMMLRGHGQNLILIGFNLMKFWIPWESMAVRSFVWVLCFCCSTVYAFQRWSPALGPLLNILISADQKLCSAVGVRVFSSQQTKPMPCIFFLTCWCPATVNNHSIIFFKTTSFNHWLAELWNTSLIPFDLN